MSKGKNKSRVLKLVKYIAKYCKVTNQFAATFLLSIFEKNNFFKLPSLKQEIILNNLISYFDNLVICFDRYGQIPTQQNRNISEKEIFAHIEQKVIDLVAIKKHLKKY